MQVKITSIKADSANREGQPYLDRDGRPKNRVTITTEEHQKRNLSCFVYLDDPIMQWRMGDVKEIQTTENGKYLNFSTGVAKTYAKPAQGAVSRDYINEELKKINEKLDRLLRGAVENTSESGEIKTEELPF